MFEPTYALHAHIARITGTEVVVGERRADFSIDVDAACALVAEQQPTIVFVCSPNNPTGTVEDARHHRGAARRDRRPRRRRRGLRRVRAAQRARARRRRRSPRGGAHVLEGVVAGRAPARLRGRAAVGRRGAREGRAPVPPVGGHADRGHGRARVRRRDARAGRPARRRAGTRRSRRSRRIARRHRVPVGRELRAVQGARRRPRALAASSSTAACSCATSRAGRASTTACASPWARPTRTTRSSRPLRESVREVARLMAEIVDNSTARRRRRRRPRARRRRQRRRAARRPASRSSTTCSSSSASTAASTSRSRPPATSRSTCTTPSRTSASCSAPRSRRRSATRPACAASRRRSCPLDEALVQVALDLSGRPFLVYEVDPVVEWIGTFDPQLCEEFWRALRVRGRDHPARALARGPERAPRHRGVVQGRGARAARRGADRRHAASRRPRARL